MAHEDLAREQLVEGSSDRGFGLLFAGAFLVIAAWPLLHAQTPRWWAMAAAAAFALVAVAKPILLAPANRVWIRFGVLLGRIASPIALGVLYYGVFTPIGALMRLTGNDPLRLKHEVDTASYWLPRQPPGPRPDSMTNQF